MNPDDETELKAKVLFLEAKIANFEAEVKRLTIDRDHHLQSSIRQQLENGRLNAALAQVRAAPEVTPRQTETSGTVVNEPVRDPVVVRNTPPQGESSTLHERANPAKRTLSESPQMTRPSNQQKRLKIDTDLKSTVKKVESKVILKPESAKSEKKLSSAGPDHAESPVNLPNSFAPLLRGVRSYILPPALKPLKNLTLSRKCIAMKYGGQSQRFLTYKKAEDKSIERRLMFPQLEYNPFLPRSPGNPGLLFCSIPAVYQEGPWSVFVKKIESPALWSYFGEYNCQQHRKMSPTEFGGQREKVQKTWACNILENRETPVYARMRARIGLRKRGKNTSEFFVADEAEKIRRGQGIPLSVEDVWKALRSGEEAPDLGIMECQGFDSDFLSKLETISSGLNQPGTHTNGRKAKVSTNHAKGRDKGKSVKWPASEDEVNSDGDDDGNDNNNDNDDGDDDGNDGSDDGDRDDDDYDGWNDGHYIKRESSSTSGPSAHTRSRARASNSGMDINRLEPRSGSPIFVILSDSDDE